MARTKRVITTQNGHQDKSIFDLFKSGKNRFYSIIFTERREICFRIINLSQAHITNVIHEEVSYYFRNSSGHSHNAWYCHSVFYDPASQII